MSKTEENQEEQVELSAQAAEPVQAADTPPENQSDRINSQTTITDNDNGAGADGEADETALLRNTVEELSKKCSELENENSQLKDQYLRKQADFENFRKRMYREKEDAIKFANSSLLGDLITIIDDFERAIKAGADAPDVESFRTGIELIEKQFTGMLERKYGLKRFDSAGSEFDPEKHEALSTEESAEHEESMVLEDYQKGYLLHDRVLRPAKVKVSVPVSNNSEQTDKTTNRGDK